MAGKLRVILDIDEVLVDFVGGACRLFGVTREAVEENWPIGDWDIITPLKVTAGIKGEFGPKEFWGRIDSEPSFWYNLHTLPWMAQVIDIVKSITDDWHIISSPSLSEASYAGKVFWLKDFLGKEFNRFCITPHKHIFAGPNVVLIDDRDSNVEAFREAGGLAITFPAYHNKEYAHRDDPMSYVRNALHELQTT